jgi:hypothetical protein
MRCDLFLQGAHLLFQAFLAHLLSINPPMTLLVRGSCENSGVSISSAISVVNLILESIDVNNLCNC